MAKKRDTYPGTPVEAARAFSTDYHQNGTPVENFKFDAEADRNAYDRLSTTEGQPVPLTQTAQNIRIKAQMKSHKNPKNRG